MDDSLSGLARFFAEVEGRSPPLVMATVLATAGSTYAKTGARVLIDPDGGASGILSGGCLEADLRERAARVLALDRPQRIAFDTRVSDDPVFGIGMGCEGAMDVWLEPIRPPEYELMRYLRGCLQSGSTGVVATVVGGEARAEELGAHGFAGVAPNSRLGDMLARIAAGAPSRRGDLRKLPFDGRELEVFVAPVVLPTSLLLCGAGPDAIPVHRFAAALGWRVTVFDHRPAFATAAAFPGAAQVVCARPEEAAERLRDRHFDAAVVMSHHLAADAEYLRWLAQRAPQYIGLLGPAARRQRLFHDVGETLRGIGARLHGPAGLDIGASSPEAIALAIIAQIQAVLAGRSGGPFV
ncbi:MAG: XdhC family protein [Gammaproteobacteria bacterium]|nr:XdhC family protein [Gammaproteobacteria bacterium]